MPDDAIRLPIRGFMTRSFDGRAVADEDDIFALGFANSLFAMQLVAFVEGHFRIDIDSDDLEIENFRSVSAISGLVERKMTAAG
ncbi:MAG TPA: phosphopantetheine-binding protein [Thermoanaerobaculia bacterium]|nr:phosphopantetheine-binding protein [Thermoanaerobaculia bacterium]